MQKPQKVLLLTLGGLLTAIAVVLLCTQPRPRATQPVYKGLELAQWLDIVARHRVNGYFSVYRLQGPQAATDATPAQVHEAEEAVRAIGTNALPHLLAWINPKPNSLIRFYRGMLGLLPLPEHARGLLWGLARTKNDTLPQFAVEGFRLLNTNALPALADLSKLANDTNHPSTADRAIDILMQLGPVAVPELLASYDGTTTGSRVQMLTFVATRNPPPDGAKAVFSKALNDPDPFVRASAADALNLINPTLRPDTQAK